MIVSFILMTILMTLSAGLFFAMLITESMKNQKRKNLKTVVIAILIGLFISILVSIDQYGDYKQWNDGKCESCGSEWKLSTVERNKGGTKTYYWFCDDCNNVIIIDYEFN